MTSDVIRAAIEQRRVTIAGARMRRTEIVITPDEAEAVAELLDVIATISETWSAHFTLRGLTAQMLDRSRALAEAITHRSTA